MPARKVRKHSDARDAADVLADVGALRVRLESKEVVELNLADECRIPTDPHDLVAAARKSAAQVAFWGYQTERALHRVRLAEGKLSEEEATQFLIWRAYYEKEDNETPPQATLRARVDNDMKCRPFRVALRARRLEYGQLRAVRDAVTHRSHTLRTLVGKIEPT